MNNRKSALDNNRSIIIIWDQLDQACTARDILQKEDNSLREHLATVMPYERTPNESEPPVSSA